MSYAFNMFFTECRQEDVMDKCLMTVENIMANAKEYMKDNSFFMPYNKFDLEGMRYKHAFTDAYLYRLFNFRFVYWPEHKLLGFSHFEGNIKDLIKEQFPMCIYFQNSCDQDYEHATWNGISLFEEYVERAKTMSAQEIVSNSDGYYSDRDVEDIEEDIEYYRRAIVYRMIFNDLNLNDWLYGRENDSFKRFAINGINSMERLLDLNSMLPPKDDF